MQDLEYGVIIMGRSRVPVHVHYNCMAVVDRPLPFGDWEAGLGLDQDWASGGV